jgi:tRNA G18 (ribose-2'-O)-methylase SpoU
LEQLSHKDIKNKQQKFPIHILCDAIRTPENIGMCFRVAESFGVEKIYLQENLPFDENRKVVKTARNTLHQIKCEFYSDFDEKLRILKQLGYTIIGIEITDKSIEIQDFNFKKLEKIVLILGSERNGISNINLTDFTISIPMHGKNSSMNVIHSLAITLYEITNQLKSNLNPLKKKE